MTVVLACFHVVAGAQGKFNLMRTHDSVTESVPGAQGKANLMRNHDSVIESMEQKRSDARIEISSESDMLLRGPDGVGDRNFGQSNDGDSGEDPRDRRPLWMTRANCEHHDCVICHPCLQAAEESGHCIAAAADALYEMENGDSDACIDPTTATECAQEVEKCDDQLNCFTGLLCLSPCICEAWKDEHCENAEGRALSRSTPQETCPQLIQAVPLSLIARRNISGHKLGKTSKTSLAEGMHSRAKSKDSVAGLAGMDQSIGAKAGCR